MVFRKYEKRNYKNLVIAVLLLVIIIMTFAVVNLGIDTDLMSSRPWWWGNSDTLESGTAGNNGTEVEDSNKSESNGGINNQTWQVAFTNIKKVSSTGQTSDVVPTYSDLTVTFRANFVNPGDKVIYELSIKNFGTLNAKLNNIIISENENKDIILCKVTGIEAGDVLKAGKSTKFYIEIEYSGYDFVEEGQVIERPILISLPFIQA